MGLGIQTALHDTVKAFLFSPAIPAQHRWRLLQRAGWADVGACYIRDGGLFVGKDVAIADGVFMNRQVFIDASARVSIGADTRIAQRVTIITNSHRYDSVRNGRAGVVEAKPVTIGEGCWIGAGAIILPGVSIADGCVIGAGAVVTRSTEANGLYLGVPARRVRDLGQ